jgi:hypothetical protein
VVVAYKETAGSYVVNHSSTWAPAIDQLEPLTGDRFPEVETHTDRIASTWTLAI